MVRRLSRPMSEKPSALRNRPVQGKFAPLEVILAGLQLHSIAAANAGGEASHHSRPPSSAENASHQPGVQRVKA